MQALEAMCASIKDAKQLLTLRPTQLVIPGPVCQWMAARGITRQDVLDMVQKTYAESKEV